MKPDVKRRELPMTISVTRRNLVLSGLAILATGAGGVLPAAARETPLVRTVRTPGCGCCLAWVRHVAEAGFRTEIEDRADLGPLRRQLRVPADLEGCHVSTVAGYVIEGHVPARDVKRLLAEQPAALGLSVPGMPVGSPGMEQGSMVERYDVVLFRADGSRVIFARY